MVKIHDKLTKQLYGRTQQEARAIGVCVKCGNPPTPFKDMYDERNYNISTLCGECYRYIFKEAFYENYDR